MRSSIFSDVIQAVVFILFLGVVLAYVLPAHAPGDMLSEGTFALNSGADLLLVALLQVLSCPFHDPVLTDRGFITREKTMLRAFVVAGILGFLAILAFSLVGVHARLEGMKPSSNVPADVARGLGFAGFFAMVVVMVTSAGSTLDSTFTSLSKLVARELPLLAGRLPSPKAMNLIPPGWAIGSGKYAILLGTNLYGLALCTAGFFLPLALPRYRMSASESAA